MRIESKKGSNATRVVAKANLPSKTCLTCNRPFTWRKKWEKCWDDVKKRQSDLMARCSDANGATSSQT
ncbi:hypothetical protein WJX75_006264 [Coccomyxa subellipsoidea]|uniref:Uncharacterized protein n=1 Tax=Coccomyxa subellipsoidea TaxID=248742 RepID=A0ABR2YD30_9CHLO